MRERVVTVGFGVFCLECEQPIRPAENSDVTGAVLYCPNCKKNTETACGITILADYKDDLRSTYKEMQKHMDLIHKILVMRFSDGSQQ